ncbi:MAG: LPXTG cell wall anchor domain-containing protein, partial [Aeromicrobium sp.]
DHEDDDIPEFTYKGVTYPEQSGSADCGEVEPPPDGDSESVTLCHATGSETNPFELITISAAGAYNGHYLDHADDDIPEFTYKGVTYGPQDGSVDCDSEPPPDGKVTLCHATGSDSNPFELITVSVEGAFNGHLGQGHQNGEDIIPPFVFEGTEYSQNWDEEGQTIFYNDCKPGDNGHDDDDDESDDDESDHDKSDVAKSSSSSADTLPDTGGSSMVLIPLGSLLVLAGSMMVGRRKAEEQ